MRKKERLVCGLDLGSWKTCIVVLRVYPNGRLELIASGRASSRGLVKSTIVDLEEAASSILRAAEDLESGLEVPADWVVAGITGEHIRSTNFRGAVDVKGKNHEVTAADMENAIRVAQSVSEDPEREDLHVLPQGYLLDRHKGIRNPVGMTGLRLDAEVHVITADSTLTQNLINAANRGQMRVRRVAFLPLAGGEAVLTSDEKAAGTALVDIGGGTTGIALFLNNTVPFASVIPVGGAHFTDDLVDGVHIPAEEAERVKLEYGNVQVRRMADDEVIASRGFGTRGAQGLPIKKACEILRCRAIELLRLARHEIERSGLSAKLAAGVVLTGGGSLLGGILELAAEILDLPVRLGVPQGVEGLTGRLAHPVYSGAIGLAIMDAREADAKGKHRSWSSSGASLPDRILSWFEDSIRQ
jgi:cell division protein FtsA